MAVIANAGIFETRAAETRYQVEVVSDPDALQALRPVWNQVVAEAGVKHPFLSHEWISAWWQSFGTGKRLHVLVVRAGAAVVGIAPLVSSVERMYGLRVRCLESPYNPHVPRFEFAATGDREAVYRALWRHLRDSADQWDVLKLCQLPGDSDVLRRLPPLAAADGFLPGRWRGEHSPYLPLELEWESYMHNLGRAHRKHIRNRLNRLSKLGPVGLEVLSGEDKLDRTLSEGFYIEAAAWKGRSGTAVISEPEVERFYREIAARFAGRGLRLLFLTVGKARVAFSFSLQHCNRLYSLKVGYNPDYARYSPSTLLCYMALQVAFERGLEEYDFLGNAEVWKLEWSSRTRPHDWLFVFAPRWRTRLINNVKFHWLPMLQRQRLYRWLRGTLAARAQARTRCGTQDRRDDPN